MFYVILVLLHRFLIILQNFLWTWNLAHCYVITLVSTIFPLTYKLNGEHFPTKIILSPITPLTNLIRLSLHENTIAVYHQNGHMLKVSMFISYSTSTCTNRGAFPLTPVYLSLLPQPHSFPKILFQSYPKHWWKTVSRSNRVVVWGGKQGNVFRIVGVKGVCFFQQQRIVVVTEGSIKCSIVVVIQWFLVLYNLKF